MSSRMRSSSYMKPRLPKSPVRLRSRQVLLSNSSSSTLQTPPGMKKPGRRLSHGDVQAKLPIALAKMVEETEDVKTGAEAWNLENLAADSAPVFERGRFYDEYSAKRNERLKRKKVVGGGGEESVVKGTPYSLGVEPTTTKKKTTTTVETTATKPPRYSLRSMTTKENKKPPPLTANVAVTSAAKNKSVTTMRGSRRI